MVNKDDKPITLQEILLKEPQDFLQPSPELQKLSICLTKRLLDPLATCSKRWRKQHGMDSLHVDGFSVDQVWEQSSSLVDLLINTARFTSSQQTRRIKNAEEEDEVEMEEDEEDVAPPSPMDTDSSEEEDDDGEFASFNDEEEEEEETAEKVKKPNDAGSSAKKSLSNGKLSIQPFSRDAHGLNDGFFAIDEFNRDTEQFEDADARGLPLGSDDESIDWNADPDLVDDSEDHNEDEDDDDEDMDSEDGQDMEDSLYRDFFVAAKKRKAYKKEVAMPEDDEEGDEEEEEVNVEFDIGPIHRDLFGQDFVGSSDGSDVDEDEDEEEGVVGTAKSSHKRRQAALVEEIRKLERENVAKRDWTLSGEARAAQRPLNSLLEEDLEFDRAGKPVPVISQEVTDSLEEMIKRRIIAEDFDELVKRTEVRLPRDASLRSRVELDDSKSQRSLAEIYEEEHLRSIDPENHPTTASANEQALKKDIKALFSDVVRKLDSLSSWHYTPKLPQPSIGVVVDAPTLEIEDAQPSAAAGGPLMGHSNIAPQEVYSAGSGVGASGKSKQQQGGDNSEFVTKGGIPIARAEMTKSEKRKRRRSKSQSFKQGDKPSSSSSSQPKQTASNNDRNSIIQKLKANNVTVIGKDGEWRDIDGKSVGEKQPARGASLKLM